MAQDSQIYKFFIDDFEGQFLFQLRILKNFRPKVGDSITDDLGRNWRVMRDEIPSQQGAARATHSGLIRITHDFRIRITDASFLSDQDATHNYFIQPANNPQRVDTWTRSDFANDRTLDQLFNNKWG